MGGCSCGSYTTVDGVGSLIFFGTSCSLVFGRTFVRVAIPHFNALSHGIAQQYKLAGYVMTAAENPRLNARVALRYSVLMFPLCFGLSYFGVTDWVFPFDSAIANGWLTYLAYVFWQQQEKNYKNGAKPTSEGLALAGVHAKSYSGVLFGICQQF